ncbi:hypothetical protein LguiB_033398 [Lonicera macranthoides]
MAEQILFNFAEGILLKLGSYAFQQLGLALGVTKELKRLESSMSTVRNILLDAEEQQVTNRAVRDWMQRLKDILFDVDEMVDEFATEALQRHVEVHGNKLKEVRNFFTSSNPFKVRYSTGRKIKGLRERLDEVLVDMESFKFAVNIVDKQIKVRRRDEAYSYVPSSSVIGREVDKEAIIQLLTCTKDEEDLDIIPIVGFGGLGKTTLAQFVYNDKRVEDHFMRRLWVCVSHEFDMEDILAKILKVLDGNDSSCKNLGIELLQNRLRQRLSDMKFFLVLDDVWNEDQVRWINLRDLLMVGRRGSKIVVTTRSRTVASIMGTVPPYELKGLSDNDCLSVLLNWAFKEGDHEKYPNLVHIGRDIVRKCGGVPLAARSLGSLMYPTIDERKWLSVRDSEVWELVQNENDILPVLRLSYDQMPSYLKQCFAYCSLLLKDQEIDKQKLIYRWMAQGFIKSSNPNQELEETGESYFNELMRRSFLEKSRSSNYKMHDLVHDLAQLVAGSECRNLRSAKTLISDGVRHVSFHNEFVIRLPEGSNTLHKGKKIRTILTSAQTLPVSFTAISLTFRYLRVLDLDDCETSIPSSVFKYLKHLRYLCMSWNHSNLPDSFSRLFNLQYLNLTSKSLEKLPKGFKNLINLRHLTLNCRGLVFLLDEWIGKLTSLRSLTIRCSRNLTSLPEAFQHLTNLRILVIDCWAALVSLSPGMRYLAALEELCLGYCENLQFRDNDFQELRNLKSLTLVCLPLFESLPGGLQCAAPILTRVSVIQCERLTTLSASLENFTSLEFLQIVNCPNLLSLPKGIQSLTKLQSLHICYCPHISRRYSENGGDLRHHISHIPNIIIWGSFRVSNTFYEKMDKRSQVYRTKAKAFKMIEGTYKEHFASLGSYMGGQENKSWDINFLKQADEGL